MISSVCMKLSVLLQVRHIELVQCSCESGGRRRGREKSRLLEVELDLCGRARAMIFVVGYMCASYSMKSRMRIDYAGEEKHHYWS